MLNAECFGRKPTVLLMTASEKSTSTDTDAESRAKFSIMSLVTENEQISTVTDLNERGKIDDASVPTTPAVPVGGGNLTSVGSNACTAIDEKTSVQFTRFSIDSIMNEEKENESKTKRLVSSTTLSKYDESQGIDSNKLPQSQVRRSTKPPSDNVLTPEPPERQFNDYAFCDKSSEVKHPQTPLEKVPTLSHSPQLPEPAFAYPVQEESMSASMAIAGYRLTSLPHTTSQTISEIVTENAFRLSDLDERPLAGDVVTTGRRPATKIITKSNATRAKKKNPTATPLRSHFTVLNIPHLPLKAPPAKRCKLSKIDVAVMRRRERARKRRDLRKSGGGGRGDEDVVSSDEYEDESDWDADDERKEVDLLVRSGPALEMDSRPEKLEFLKVFRLTTHDDQNSIELQKMERRKWISSDLVRKEENTDLFSLNLPVPSISLLDEVRSHNQKSNFLQSLGLKTVSTETKKDMEEIWREVVKERLRRKCESSLTKYYQKVFKSTAVEDRKLKTPTCCNSEMSTELLNVRRQIKEHTDDLRLQSSRNRSIPHIGNIEAVPSELSLESNRNRVFPPNTDLFSNSSKLPKLQGCRNVNSQLDKEYVVPPDVSVVSLGFENTDNVRLHTSQSDFYRNKSVVKSVLSDKNMLMKGPLRMQSRNMDSNHNPSPMVFIDSQNNISRGVDGGSNSMEITVRPQFSWPGLLEIKEAYERYSKEKVREMVELRDQGRVLANDTLKKQAEVKFLERKQRNIYATLSRTDREKKELLRIIDQLTYFINCFR